NASDASAEAVHVIENAKRGCNTHDPENREPYVEGDADEPGDKRREELRTDAGDDQNQGRDRHSNEKLDLVMRQTPVVEETNDSDQGCAGENAKNLFVRPAMTREQNGQCKSEEDRDTAHQRHRFHVDFARSGLIDHAEAQGQMTDGNREY